jgi:hypothetical protein
VQTLTGVVGVTEDVGIDVKRGRGVAVSQCITHLYDVHPALLSDLGGEEQLSTLERLLAEHAALASAVVADSYTRWLKGEQIALSELSTVSNTYMRAAMALGLNRRAKDVTASIDTYLNEENAPDEAAHSASKSS